MSKMADLASTLDDLREAGKALIDVADNLRSIYSAAPEEPAEPVTEDESEEAIEESAPAPKKEIKFEEVRAVMARKTRVSKENTEAIRQLLNDFGAKKLSDVKPEDYEALLHEAEVIPDA